MDPGIDPELLAFFQSVRENFTEEHRQYLSTHPEIGQLLSDYVAKLLMSKPSDVYDFTRAYFKFFENRSVDSKLKPLVLTAPSGCGKGTLIARLLREFPHLVAQSMSHTTRMPRLGETSGSKYVFTSKAMFEEQIAAGSFLEYVKYNGHYYGTTRRTVEEVVRAGKVCIVEIEIKGAQKVHADGVDANYVFVMPPTFEALRDRLRKRGSEGEEKIEARLCIAKTELEEAARCPFFTRLVNDDFEAFYAQFLSHLRQLYPSFNFHSAA